MPKKSVEDQKAQRERFIDTARALECNEDKERFEEKLRQIAKAKITDNPAPAPRRHHPKLPPTC